MDHGETFEKRRAVLAAAAGSAVLVAYSVAGALQTLVWNPLTAGGLFGPACAREPRAGRLISGYLVLIVLAAPSHWFVALPSAWELRTLSRYRGAIMLPRVDFSI